MDDLVLSLFFRLTHRLIGAFKDIFKVLKRFAWFDLRNTAAKTYPDLLSVDQTCKADP